MTTRHAYRVYIRATAEQVWQALVDPELTRQYFHGTAFDTPPVEGQAYQTSMEAGVPAVDGTIEVLEPPRRLVQTWHVLYDEAMAGEPPSRIEWTITDAGEGLVRLDVIHGDLAGSPLTWAHVKDGWVWILDSLKSLLETGAPLPPETDERPVVNDPSGEWHRMQAIAAHNEAWGLIEAERTPADDEAMLRAAYASAYHWQRAAGAAPANEVRARYLLAKTHLLAGHPDLSLAYAEACLAGCIEADLADFDLAYAHEARARALLALGRRDEGLAAWDLAKAVPIADAEDRAIVEGDFADAP